LARAGARRPVARRHSQSAGPVGAHGHDPIRLWPALFALADHAAAALDVFYSDRLGRGALRAADRARLVPALLGGLGAHRRDAVGAVRRGPHRRSHQAGLSRHSGAARAPPLRAGAAAGIIASAWSGAALASALQDVLEAVC